MAFIVEDGNGFATANSYATTAFVLAYLTERNRQTENTWDTLAASIQQAHIIGATDHIENRFRDGFMGTKEFKGLKLAKGVLNFVGIPVATETVTIGTTVYTFENAMASPNDVLITSTANGSINNLINAINALSSEAGITHGLGTVQHPDVSARATDGDSLVAEARVEGFAGNTISTLTTFSGGTWSAGTLIGGSDVGRVQRLSFPRLHLVDRDGNSVLGIPERLKQATAEYSVRSAGSVLLPDPDMTTGLQVVEKEEVVGPLTERTKWMEGGRGKTTVSYPAADRLLMDFLVPTGLLLRG